MCGSVARAAVVSTIDLTCSVRRKVEILTFVGLCAAACRGAALAVYMAFELTLGPCRPAQAPAVAGAGLTVVSDGLSPPSGERGHRVPPLRTSFAHDDAANVARWGDAAADHPNISR